MNHLSAAPFLVPLCFRCNSGCEGGLWYCGTFTA